MYRPNPFNAAATAHGPDCPCAVCAPQTLANAERLTSTARLAWLENQVVELSGQLEQVRKRLSMGYALWCKPGKHSFDEQDPDAERMTTDERDEKGKKTGKEITYHVCGDHMGTVFQGPVDTPPAKQIPQATVEG